MTSGISRDEWLRALSDVGASLENDPAAVTVAEFQAMFGMTRQNADRSLKRLEAAGRAVRTRKVGVAPDGRTVRYVAYRLRQEA